ISLCLVSATIARRLVFSPHPAPSEIYTLSLHDALPIYGPRSGHRPARYPAPDRHRRAHHQAGLRILFARLPPVPGPGLPVLTGLLGHRELDETLGGHAMSHTATLIPPQAPPPVPPRPFTAARFFGNAFMGVWLALTVGVFLLMAAVWDPQKLTRYGPGYLSGFGVTLLLVGLSVVLGGLLSLPLAFARMSKNRIFSGFAYVYVYFFRGTPLLTQLFLVYYGLGSFSAELKAMGLWWFFRDAWNCALLTFTLNTAAYQAEILRGAIESVPRGQHEGAAALGLPRSVAFFKVILPQALIVALRPYGNEIILMIKGSAI